MTRRAPQAVSRTLLALLLLGGAFPLAHAQTVPDTDAPPVSTAPADDAAQDDKPVTTLRVNSNLVTMFFTVRDKRGALIPDLTRDDCQISEAKTPQKLRSFSAEANQPLTLGILLDTSGSQERVLPMEQQAGSEFLHQVLDRKDEAFLISFDVDVNLLADYSNNAGELSHAMDKATINTAAGNGASGIPGLGQGTIPTQGAPKGTLLYDAVVLASHDKLAGETGRKALILLTDGEDMGSKYRVQDAIEAAQRSNTIVYVILIADRRFYSGGSIMLGGYNGGSMMRQLADATGGRLIDVGSDSKKLEGAFGQIEDELRTQYVASYVPLNTNFDGRFRLVDVQCKDLKVQVRKGYYATQQVDDTQ